MLQNLVFNTVVCGYNINSLEKRNLSEHSTSHPTNVSSKSIKKSLRQVLKMPKDYYFPIS